MSKISENMSARYQLEVAEMCRAEEYTLHPQRALSFPKQIFSDFFFFLSNNRASIGGGGRVVLIFGKELTLSSLASDHAAACTFTPAHCTLQGWETS